MEFLHEHEIILGIFLAIGSAFLVVGLFFVVEYLKKRKKPVESPK